MFVSSFREPTWSIISNGTNVPAMRVVLLNVDGGESPGIHESIGLECVARAIINEMHDVELLIGDLQFDILEGSLNLDLIASEVVQYLDMSPVPALIGLGIPIYAWDNARELIYKVNGRLDANHSSVHWALGNAVATYTKPELLLNALPKHVTIVQGDGETGILPVLRALRNGTEPPTVVPFSFLAADEYQTPLRIFTRAVVQRGGAPKMEASRGCDWGHCTFCSRCGHRGSDYRAFDATTIVSQMQQVIDMLGPTRFEFADEEAFGDKIATDQLTSHLEECALPSTFMVSLRIPTLLERADDGIITRLVKVGLRKVFIGVEGGSDPYLKLMAKGQRIDEIDRAVNVIEQHGLDCEMGFITFSWRMSYAMLVGNVEFLRTYHRYVSWLFNNLEVRGGTADETLLWQYYQKGLLGDYDPAEHFSINDSVYRDVPFLDQRVAEALAEAERFADDLRPQYSLKSLVRAKSLHRSQAAEVQQMYRQLQELHFRALDDIVNNHSHNIPDLRNQRLNLLRRASIALDGAASENELAGLVQHEIQEYIKATGKCRI
jgi:hypothetical protein